MARMVHNRASMRGARRALAWTLATVLNVSAALGEEPMPSDPPPVPVETQTPPDGDSAESLLAQGIELRKRREDRLALVAFERAWTLGGSPRALAQVALAEQALGYWREAHEHLEQALGYADDAWISAHQATLDVALKEMASRLGAVEVSCNVDGAEVRVDGRLVGRTPLRQPIRVAAGKSVVQVVAEGYFDAMRQTQVDAEGLARVDFTLTPLAPTDTQLRAPEVPLPLAEPPGPTPQFQPLSVSVAPAATPPAEGASARDVLTYTTTGLAALGAAIAVTGYVMREVNVKQYNNDERCDAIEGTSRSDECRTEFDAWRRGEVMAIAGSASAGVFGLTALYLWLSRPDATSDSTSLSCAISVSSVTCGSAF